jgi:hypothetical protein
MTLVLVLLGSLRCFFTPAAVALQYPSNVVTLKSSSKTTNIKLLAGNSYKLGAGVFVLNNTVVVDGPDDVIW